MATASTSNAILSKLFSVSNKNVLVTGGSRGTLFVPLACGWLELLSLALSAFSILLSLSLYVGQQVLAS